MHFSFPKQQRLSKKKDIEALFRSGKSMVEFPLKLIYLKVENDGIPLKLGISIPKKKHKKAIDRNLLKRRLREAYRKNNAELKSSIHQKNSSLHLFIIYLSSEKLEYSLLEDKIILLLQRLEQIDGKIT